MVARVWRLKYEKGQRNRHGVTQETKFAYFDAVVSLDLS